MLESGSKVVGYVRVSSAKQAKLGLSLDAQEAAVRAYAQAHRLDLVDVIPDRGKSAKSLRRPGVKRVLAMLDAGDVAGLVITKLDRLTRRIRDAVVLFDEYFPSTRPLWLLSTSDPIDTKTVDGRMVAYFMATLAQHEREKTEARNVSIVTHQRAKGKQVGHAPFGYHLAEDRQTLIPCPEDLETLATARALKAAGRSTREIAAELTRLGRPTKRGRGGWAHSTVADILRPAPAPDLKS